MVAFASPILQRVRLQHGKHLLALCVQQYLRCATTVFYCVAFDCKSFCPQYFPLCASNKTRIEYSRFIQIPALLFSAYDCCSFSRTRYSRLAKHRCLCRDLFSSLIISLAVSWPGATALAEQPKRVRQSIDIPHYDYVSSTVCVLLAQVKVLKFRGLEEITVLSFTYIPK